MCVRGLSIIRLTLLVTKASTSTVACATNLISLLILKIHVEHLELSLIKCQEPLEVICHLNFGSMVKGNSKTFSNFPNVEEM
jgi:hypothetical protein